MVSKSLVIGPLDPGERLHQHALACSCWMWLDASANLRMRQPGRISSISQLLAIHCLLVSPAMPLWEFRPWEVQRLSRNQGLQSQNLGMSLVSARTASEKFCHHAGGNHEESQVARKRPWSWTGSSCAKRRSSVRKEEQVYYLRVALESLHPFAQAYAPAPVSVFAEEPAPRNIHCYSELTADAALREGKQRPVAPPLGFDIWARR